MQDISQDLWDGLPQVNQRAAVHWLAVITVKTVISAGGAAATSAGTGE